MVVIAILLIVILLFIVLDREPQQIDDKNPEKPIAGEVGGVVRKDVIVVKDPEIPAGSIAIFYRTSMSSVKERLPVFVEDVNNGGGYATNIRWESSQNGVVRYIPSVDKLDVMGTTNSYSYSKGYISAHTVDGRVFLFRHRGDSSTLTEVDPRNAEVKGSIPIDDVDFAIVGDDVYFREEIRNDLFDKRTGGGELFMQSLKGGSPNVVLEYGDTSNKGRFYGVAGSLISVLSDYTTNTDSVRKHDLQTGQVIETLSENIPAGSYFEGDDALYQIIVNDKIYSIYRLSMQGERKLIIQLELEEGEKGLSVDEEDGKLLIVSYKSPFEAKQIALYEIASNKLGDISFEPFGSTSSPDYQFVILG